MIDEDPRTILNCAYHATSKMRVVSFGELQRLLATGEWFDHPSLKNTQEIPNHDERRSNSEHETEAV
jgi:hypothetical protein